MRVFFTCATCSVCAALILLQATPLGEPPCQTQLSHTLIRALAPPQLVSYAPRHLQAGSCSYITAPAEVTFAQFTLSVVVVLSLSVVPPVAPFEE
jgi:hypothetical protein